MQIFICTFLIKLQYVKKVKQSSDKKLPPVTFEALLKGPKNHIIASGSNKPSLMNDTAWFNQSFQIKSDLLFNPETQAYNQSTLTLQIKCQSKLTTTTHIKSFSLAEVAEKKVISERDYFMTGGLIANLELVCSQMSSKGVKPLRMNGNSPEQARKTEEEVKSFLLLETVSFTEEKSNHDTPEFHEQESKEMEEELQQQPLVLEKDLGPQLLALREQFHNQQKEHKVTKEKLKSIKQLLEKEYNTNRELNLTIGELNKKIQQEKAKYLSLENHLSETENLCNALSATLSHKETDIIQAEANSDQLRKKLLLSTKRNEEAEGLERTKAQLQWQVATLKKEIEGLKANLSRYFLSDNETKGELQKAKNQNSKLKKLKQKLDEQVMKLLLKDKQNSLTIARQVQQIDSIKRQTQKWRAEFAIESQRKDEELSHLQQHYNQIYTRYFEIQKKEETAPKSVKKEVYENMKKDYQQRLEQKQEKEDKLRQQLEIIEEEILNLQELLEEKEDNEELLVEHIKKLQHEVDTYAISDKWWSAILEKQRAPESEDRNDEVSKLQSRNKKLIDLLQKNSYTILQGEKYKLQLTSLKKDHEQLIHKLQTLAEEERELKEKISTLYRQNKKLQEKNFNLNREKEALSKKNQWLEEEIVQAKNLEKQARQDYDIVSFQLSKITNKMHEERQHLSMKHLSVIRENSQELIASSHKLLRDSSIKQKTKSDNQGLQRTIYLQLLKLIEQRANQSQQICSELQHTITPRLLTKGQTLTKDLRRLSIQTSKIKTILMRAGKSQLIGQWQQVVSSLMSEMQQFIINN